LLILELSLQLINIGSQITQLGHGQLKLSLRPERHLLYLLLILSILSHDVFLLILSVLLNLSDGLFIIMLLVLNFLSHLLCLSCLGLHGCMVFVHQVVNLLVMCLNHISNCLFKVSCFFFLLGLELLELSSILKHFLGVGVPILLKLNLLVIDLSFDLFFKNLLKVTLVLHERVISISMLELRAG